MEAGPVIAVAMGDPVGIGPEVIVRALAEDGLRGRCRAFVIGDLRVMRDAAAASGSPLRFRELRELRDARFAAGVIEVLTPPGLLLDEPREPGVHPEYGAAAARYVELAYRLAMQGGVDGVVMAPMNKEAFRAAGYDYLDELQFLGSVTGCDEPFILAAAGPVWAVAVTEHIPFSEIVSGLSREGVRHRIAQLHRVLRRLGQATPRLACAALNPHGGEGGMLGREELDIIAPAIGDARAQGIEVDGPVPADVVFKRALDGDFDGVVCMYHDQLNIARKLLARQDIATLWMGLPVIGATTAHGTAFDIAGQGVADAGSLRAALDYVIRLAGREDAGS